MHALRLTARALAPRAAAHPGGSPDHARPSAASDRGARDRSHKFLKKGGAAARKTAAFEVVDAHRVDGAQQRGQLGRRHALASGGSPHSSGATARPRDTLPGGGGRRAGTAAPTRCVRRRLAPRRSEAGTAACTSGRWVTPARLNGITLQPPTQARPHAIRPSATHIAMAGVPANLPEPTSRGARGGCDQVP
mgnify:CR=1 FL=1